MNAACVSDAFVHILFKYGRQMFHNVSYVLSQADVEFDMSLLAAMEEMSNWLFFFFFLNVNRPTSVIWQALSLSLFQSLFSNSQVLVKCEYSLLAKCQLTCDTKKQNLYDPAELTPTLLHHTLHVDGDKGMAL